MVSCYREVRLNYRESYDRLMAGGLYQRLVDEGLLVPHEEIPAGPGTTSSTYKILRPQRIPFISYPYEWCFSQLKAAALTTLRVQLLAHQHGFLLKDASAYNVQFLDATRPLLIDTLSFEPYIPGSPWVAYRQFCQHFLAPLALMAYCDVRLSQLLRVHLDGVPLDLAASLLPKRSLLKPALLLHIHLHARSQRRWAARDADARVARRSLSARGLLGVLDSLAVGVRALRWHPRGTEWVDYYRGDSYEEEAFAHKAATVRSFLERVTPSVVWDLGANTGYFSQMAAQMGARTVAIDMDAAGVEHHYRRCIQEARDRVLPLVVDLTNPSPNLGWATTERLSLLERGCADLTLALALVYHLAISNNLPLAYIAAFLAGLSPWLIVEFVPKEDPKVRRLLATRQDVFPEYTQEGFEDAFRAFYTIESAVALHHSRRSLYLMRRE